MWANRLCANLIILVIVSLTCLNGAHAGDPKESDLIPPESTRHNNGEEIIVSDEPTIPVAPGQISTTDKRALNHAHRRHFDAFNARHHNRWKANINKKDGKVRVLFGNRSKSYAGGAEIAARGFLKEARDLFRMREDLEDLKTSRIDKSFRRHHVRFQQTYDGVPVKGAYTIVHANEAGQVSMVQNDYRDDLQVDNVRLVAREDAARIALNDLYPDLDEETIVFDARAEEMIVPHRGGHRFVWKVTIPTQRPYALWVYHVDAQHYTILYKANEILSLRKGKGRVYKSNKDWFKRRTRIQSLPNMFTAADGFQSGWLYGRHADIYDDNGNDPFAPNYRFIYDPNLPSEKPWFDATTAYYSLNSIRGWWQSKVLKKYGPANPDYYFTLSIPTIVNVLDYCNAFYTPDLGAGYPGFVFGNEESCYPGSEDLVLDQSIVSHEFTHAMMDWCGFDSQFGGALHNYGRAMGEGNADWFAYLYTKSTKIGAVLYDDTLDGYLRNINNTMIYPDDVDDPYFGVPQEHYTGQIWGGYLYDLNRHLKSKALKFIYQGLFYFTAQGGHRPNRADFYDAIHAQILAEQDLTNGKYKNAAKAWGCMASRGINGVLRPVYSHPSNYFGTGSPGSDQTAYFAWSFPEVKRIKTKGCVLKPSDTNEFPIIISEAERDLKISVKAAASMAPELELYTTDATHVATGTTKGKKANLTVADIPAGEYVIVLSANQGCYSININVK